MLKVGAKLHSYLKQNSRDNLGFQEILKPLTLTPLLSLEYFPLSSSLHKKDFLAPDLLQPYFFMITW